jgi:hypothetical protein
MAYILAKQSTLNGIIRNLYYLVESYRENGKVKRKKILGLGESKDFSELIDRLGHKEREIKGEIQEWEDKLKVNRFWKFQRIAQKCVARERLKLGKLEQFQKKVEEVKQAYKM